MPGAPASADVTTNGVTIMRRILLLQNGQISFLVGYADFPIGHITADLMTKVVTAERDALVTTMKGRVIAERTVAADGRTWNEFQIRGPTTAVMTERLTLVRLATTERLFILGAGTELQPRLRRRRPLLRLLHGQCAAGRAGAR